MFPVRLICVLILSGLLSAAQAPKDSAVLPYRFLLVIADQWKDPASSVIDDGGEFQIVAALLKTWGIPFEILRLDQQRFDKYHLLDREGRPRYGTIIWDTGPGEFDGKGIDLVGDLVVTHGVGLIVLGDTVAIPEIAGLAGIRYVSDYISQEDMSVTLDHFVTRGFKDRHQEFLQPGQYLPGNKVTVESATVVASRGSHPFITVRETQNGGRVVWLGAHRPSAQIGKQIVRDVFKRSLVWVQRYALYAEYPRSIILFMDDMGTSEKTYLPYWHYRTLSEEEIRRGLIEPLKEHNAVLVQNVNTGFVDRKTQRVLNPWKQSHAVDELDPKIIHDYASTKRGLDAGVKEGVFEIQSHGWTHMLPDLDSPPGPWWTAPMDGAGSLSWYTEFGDRPRKKEIPAATQKYHMQRAVEYIQEDFGTTPLFINPGGGEISRSYANHTARIAAGLGFGLSKTGAPHYLGNDLVLRMEPVIQNGRMGV